MTYPRVEQRSLFRSQSLRWPRPDRDCRLSLGRFWRWMREGKIKDTPHSPPLSYRDGREHVPRRNGLVLSGRGVWMTMGRVAGREHPPHTGDERSFTA